ncbi:MAG: hypothetical protein LBD67_05230 [Candidatus Accumulibacter sp.]|nr:hypothetical protein [Accumulibacter sp.]
MTKKFLAILLALLFLMGDISLAEGVYVIQGPGGPTFSNVPQPGSKEVDLRPLTVIQSTKPEDSVPARAAPAREYAREPGGRPAAGSRNAPWESVYQNFSVTWPQDSGSVIINPGTFDVRLAIDPALRIEEGHAFSVSINGEPVRERFTATEFMIPPEFFGDSLPVNQFASLQASIVDRDGIVVKKAEPVRFFMRFTTVLQNPNLSPNPGYPYPVRPITPARPGHRPEHRESPGHSESPGKRPPPSSSTETLPGGRVYLHGGRK